MRRQRAFALAGPRSVLPFVMALALVMGGLGSIAVARRLPLEDLVPQRRDVRVAQPVGPRDATPVQLVVALDDSGSTSSSDPSGGRFSETRAVARALARAAGTANDRLIVAHFADDHTTSRALPLGDAQAIDAALRVPSTIGGGTNIVGAIESLNPLCSRAGTHTVVVLITDGADNGPLSRVSASLAATPCRVAMVALDTDRAFLGLEPEYRHMTLRAGLSRADSTEPGAFTGSIMAAFSSTTGQHAPEGGWVELVKPSGP